MINYIHVGIHKAGSTFLQKNIFSKLKNVSYLGFYEKDYLLDEVRNFQTCSDFNFNENKIKGLLKFFEENKKKNIATLISSEGFTGTIQPQYFGSGVFIELIAKRIARYVENPKIILILRNQKDAIRSLYKDDIQFGYNCHFNEWIDERLKINSLDYFKYDKIVELYQLIFGEENVKVFFYENIFQNENNLKLFIDNLNLKLSFDNLDEYKKLLNDKSNISNDYLTTIISKHLNKFISTKLSKGYTSGRYNILPYNLWRYTISKKISSLKILNKNFDSDNFQKYLKDLNIDNKKLFQNLNMTILESYRF